MFQHADQSQIQFPCLVNDSAHSAEPNLDQILCAVSGYFKVNGFSIKSRRKAGALHIPRQISLYLSVQHTALSYSEIGQFFAGRSAATVRAHCLKMQKTIQENAFFETIVTDISHNILRQTK